MELPDARETFSTFKSLQKTIGIERVSLILVRLMSCSTSNFERSNISFKENKPDGVDLNSEPILTLVFERKKEKLNGFLQTVNSEVTQPS